MASYRLHFMAWTGERVSSRDLEAKDDEKAIELAEGLRGLTALELWRGTRQIRRWDSFPPDQ